jgi:hypothetical protein
MIALMPSTASRIPCRHPSPPAARSKSRIRSGPLSRPPIGHVLQWRRAVCAQYRFPPETRLNIRVPDVAGQAGCERFLSGCASGRIGVQARQRPDLGGDRRRCREGTVHCRLPHPPGDARGQLAGPRRRTRPRALPALRREDRDDAGRRRQSGVRAVAGGLAPAPRLARLAAALVRASRDDDTARDA